MAKYAAGTNVSAGASRLDIERLLKGNGITKFAVFHGDAGHVILFERAGISYRLNMPGLDYTDRELTHNRQGRPRTAAQVSSLGDQEYRRRWRALFIVLKAKLVAVTDDIVTFEREFLSYAMTKDGQTVGDHIVPKLAAGASIGLAQLALPGGK